jgi:hypothetical protein
MKNKSKIIIGIHGLGNKPPKATLEKWWKQAITDGLKLNNFPPSEFNFELIYWADILHPVPLDMNGKSKSNSIISERYTSEEYPERIEPLTFRAKALEYMEKYYNKFIVNEVLSLKYPTITEFFIHLHLKDLQTYYSKEFIHYDGKEIPAKEAIIDRFIKSLDKHKDKKIFLIAHSMGSMIVQDAYTEYSPETEIDSYVTIGSPLGQKYVINKYRTESEKNNFNKLKVPEKILKNWYNLSDLQDQVALNHQLSGLYEYNSQKVKIQDQLVNNKFVSAGTKNPHKAFGYLRTPEFSKIINEFLVYKKTGIFEWIKKIFRT